MAHVEQAVLRNTNEVGHMSLLVGNFSRGWKRCSRFSMRFEQ
jgi:hypothetical protein